MICAIINLRAYVIAALESFISVQYRYRHGYGGNSYKSGEYFEVLFQLLHFIFCYMVLQGFPCGVLVVQNIYTG